MQFKFRLQSLVEIRLAQRDTRRAELRRAEDHERTLSERHSRLTDELRAARERGCVGPGAVRPDELLRWHEHQRRVRDELQRALVELQAAGRDIERCRQALLDADRAVKVLDKLRERQRADHERELRGLETRQLDEAARAGHDLPGGWA